MNIRFEPVKTMRRASGACPVCGKKTTRSRTFEHTVSPFNRNTNGQVKSREEVRADVHDEAEAWQPDFRHPVCREAQA